MEPHDLPAPRHTNRITSDILVAELDRVVREAKRRRLILAVIPSLLFVAGLALLGFALTLH